MTHQEIQPLCIRQHFNRVSASTTQRAIMQTLNLCCPSHPRVVKHCIITVFPPHGPFPLFVLSSHIKSRTTETPSSPAALHKSHPGRFSSLHKVGGSIPPGLPRQRRSVDGSCQNQRGATAVSDVFVSFQTSSVRSHCDWSWDTHSHTSAHM